MEVNQCQSCEFHSSQHYFLFLLMDVMPPGHQDDRCMDQKWRSRAQRLGYWLANWLAGNDCATRISCASLSYCGCCARAAISNGKHMRQSTVANDNHSHLMCQ